MKKIVYALAGAGIVSALLLFALLFAGFFYTLSKADDGVILNLLSLVWKPEKGHYGIIPMLVTSVAIAALAVSIAVPIGFGLLWRIWGYDNISSKFLRNLLRFMSGIPTVVYGFCGLIVLVPFLRAFGCGSGFGIASVSLVLSFTILPSFVLTADSAIYGLMSRSENILLTSGALGLEREKAILYLVFYVCRKQIAAGGVLAFGRALGDTLIALMISGNAPVMPDGLFSPVRTLAAHISLLTAVEINTEIELSMLMAGITLMLLAVCMSILIRILQK